MADDTGVGAVLADLHRRNCFVVQHGQGEPVYEFHGLFRSFLLDRAAVQFAPPQWRALQCRAADMLAQSRQADAAAALYRAAGDPHGLAALTLREAPALIAAGRHHTLAQWLGELPPDAFRQSSWLWYWRAAAHRDASIRH